MTQFFRELIKNSMKDTYLQALTAYKSSFLKVTCQGTQNIRTHVAQNIEVEI